MKTVEVDGLIFTKASELAKDFGYTADYLGQLARSGKVNAQLIGRSWYVNQDSLNEHRENRYKVAESPQRITTVPNSINTTDREKGSVSIDLNNQNFYERAATYSKIDYEVDHSELIPSLHTGADSGDRSASHNVAVHLAGATNVPVSNESESDIRFKVPKRPPVQFSGSLTVTSIEDSVQEAPQYEVPAKNGAIRADDTKKTVPTQMLRRGGAITISKVTTPPPIPNFTKVVHANTQSSAQTASIHPESSLLVAQPRTASPLLTMYYTAAIVCAIITGLSILTLESTVVASPGVFTETVSLQAENLASVLEYVDI